MNRLFFSYIMSEIFEHRDIWQPILSILTHGSFMLDVQNPIALTHTLTALRRTCRAAHAMIPPPTRIPASELFLISVQNGDVEMFKLAELHKGDNFFINYHDTLLRASSRGYYEIVEHILSAAKIRQGAMIECECLEIAARNGYLEICRILCEHGAHYPEHYMVRGAAEGHHLHIIEFARQTCGINYDALFAGALLGENMDLCVHAITVGGVDITHGVEVAADKNSEIMCTHLRDYAKEHKLLTEEFYYLMIASASYQNNLRLVYLAHEWSIDDGYRLNYTKLLCRILKTDIAMNAMLSQETKTICNIIHNFGVSACARINYDAIIHNLGDFADSAAMAIWMWARDDGYCISEPFGSRNEIDGTIEDDALRDIG